jgi:hypothetical protein
LKPACCTQLLPAASQRSQLNVKVIGCVPVHVPGWAWSVWPWDGVPEIVGACTFRGLPASGFAITAVAFEATVALPSAFDAVTRTRRRRSTSAEATT